MRLWALAGDGSRRELEVEESWPHKSYLVLKFAGIESISDADALVTCELQVPESERARLEPGWAYVSDLIGCVVFDGLREIGKVHAVQFGAGEAPLLVVRSGSKEYEIPYAEAYLASKDDWDEASGGHAGTQCPAERGRERAAAEQQEIVILIGVVWSLSMDGAAVSGIRDEDRHLNDLS